MAQLNFQIPDPLLARLDAAKPDYLDRKGFLCLLLDQALDASGTLGLPSAAKEVPLISSSSSNKKNISNKRINTLIEQHEELIREFWKGKGGAKSDTAWRLLMTELEKLQKDHGDAVVREQLQLAINGKWKGISAARYEQFKAPKGNTPAQPDQKHPAYRPASEVLAESERLAQQNLEHLRRKQEEAQPVSGPLADLF